MALDDFDWTNATARDYAEAARDTTWEDFDHCPLDVFNSEYAMLNPIVADDGSEVWFTGIGSISTGGYEVTCCLVDGGWVCELTRDPTTWDMVTGIAQSGPHDDPRSAWEDSRKRFCKEMEG